MSTRAAILLALFPAVFLIGCTKRVGTGWDWNRMRLQPRYSTWGASTFFKDGKAMQAPPTGTVSREMDSVSGTPSITRGADRYHIFCSVCHGETAAGDGIVGRNMDPPPPALISAHVQTLNDSTIAFIIAHGFGRMPPFAEQLDATDRAAVVAYLRSLASGSKGNTPRNLP